jgi:branched-chain amino acid aminotransferase
VLWHRRQITDDHRAEIDLTDRGLTLGDGLFETLLIVGGKPFRLDDHLDRMLASAEVLRLPISRAEITVPINDLAERAPRGAAVIRITVTRGSGPRGLRLPPHPQPTIFATAAPWQIEPALRSARLATASIRRNRHSPLSRLKTLAYLDNILALQEALERGADDALILNTDDHVACASTANLFVIRGADLLTPPLHDGVLAGVTRKLVLQFGATLGLNAREASIGVDDLHAADAVFLTNSVSLVTLVTALDGAPLKNNGVEFVERLRDLLVRQIETECEA